MPSPSCMALLEAFRVRRGDQGRLGQCPFLESAYPDREQIAPELESRRAASRRVGLVPSRRDRWPPWGRRPRAT